MENIVLSHEEYTSLNKERAESAIEIERLKNGLKKIKRLYNTSRESSYETLNSINNIVNELIN